MSAHIIGLYHRMIQQFNGYVIKVTMGRVGRLRLRLRPLLDNDRKGAVERSRGR